MKCKLKLAVLLMLFSSLVFTACGGFSAGDKTTLSIDGISLTMAYVPGELTCPTGLDDLGTATVDKAYWIGETEVTYELWNKVYTWATDPARGANIYTFANVAWQGKEDIVYLLANGYTPLTTDQHPATMVNWRDAMVFCNALCEFIKAETGVGPDCVYYTDSSYTIPLRSVDAGSVDTAEGHQDNPYVNPDAKGFRLLTTAEWEVAVRYIDGSTWLYGDHASGDTSGPCFALSGTGLGGEASSTIFGDYAVYVDNSGLLTSAVKSKSDNSLGLYDMSGNVSEWCFDWYTSGSKRIQRGGDWFNTADYLRAGNVNSKSPRLKGVTTGLRLARTSLVQE